MPWASASCLTGGACSSMLAAGGAVGLGEDQRDLVAGGDDGLERGDGELGRAAEDEFHDHPRRRTVSDRRNRREL